MNAPKLRFKEFNDEWDYKIFDELINIKSESYNPSLKKENYKCIELEHINQNTGTINGYCNSQDQKSNKNIFKKNEVLFGKLRPYLKKYWYATFDGVCSSEIWVGKSKNQNIVTNKFIYDLFQSHYFLQLCNLSTGSKMPRADWSFIKEQSIAIPNILEQKKISETLELLDKKIELQSKKIEALKLFKKGLNKFVFSNCTDEYKIENLIIEYSNKTTENNQYEVLSSTANGIAFQNEYFNKQAASNNNTGYKIIPKGFITYRSMSDTGEFHFNIQDITDIGIVSPAYPVFNIKKNLVNKTYFVYYINENDGFKNEILSTKEGGTRYALSITKFKTLNILLPKIEEQIKYSKYINIIINKIQLEEKKFEKLIQLKKGLMQNMFV